MSETSYKKNIMQYNMDTFITFIIKIALNKGILS